MTQPKLQSAIETVVNNLIGVAISYWIGMLIYPLLGITVTPKQNIITVVVFTTVSMIRGYIVRRAFNRWASSSTHQRRIECLSSSTLKR